MKLIAGLGNPGRQYQFTRHNVGFLVLDHLADRYGISLARRGFDALYGKGWIADEEVLLAEPQTYMNLSGASMSKLLSYFKIDVSDLLVVHDDLDLPFETIRLKKGGGEGGHKGLLSIAHHLGSSDFLRVRLGIGKPVHRSMTEGYVLSPFTEEEQKALPRLLAEASDAVRDILGQGLEAAMRIHHGKKQGLKRFESATDNIE